MAHLVFRLPGHEQYSYVEVSFDTDLRLGTEGVADELKAALEALNEAYPKKAAPAAAGPSQPAAAPAQSADPLRTCVHGNRTLREGKSAGGKAWGAWMCPEKDRSQQCKPLDFITGQPWGAK
jgi:hypothetical protein